MQYYAVFSNGAMIHFGSNQKEALAYLKGNATLVSVNSLEDLLCAFESHWIASQVRKEDDNDLSNAFTSLLDRLDRMGINEENAEDMMSKLKENSKKVVSEAKSLGVQGMKAVGEGFIALGDLLVSTGKDKDK